MICIELKLREGALWASKSNNDAEDIRLGWKKIEEKLKLIFINRISYFSKTQIERFLFSNNLIFFTVLCWRSNDSSYFYKICIIDLRKKILNINTNKSNDCIDVSVDDIYQHLTEYTTFNQTKR